MTTRLWLKIVRHQRIIRQDTQPCVHENPHDALEAVCARMDLPKPIWFPKNEREWAEFGLTRFTQEHFMETIPYDRMEIEYINPDAQKKKDPRTEA